MELKIGDEVQFKSGGPHMLVDVVDGEKITCKWYDKDSKSYKSDDFNINQLNYLDPNRQTILVGSQRRNF